MTGQIRRPRGSNHLRHGEQGYVLLTLLLFVAVAIVAAALVAQPLAFQIKRDREEELIHRGVQYSRAIRSYAKKTGRYPVTLDQLRDTGGIKFIRKLYKDPITGGDFRLLHMGDVVSLTAPPNLNTSMNANGSDGNPDNSNAPANSNATPADPAVADSQSNPGNRPPTQSPGLTSSLLSSNNGPLSSNNGAVNEVGQVIFGVASKSKARTIREFDHKSHYNEWFFFYDPARDRGAEIKGPTSLSTVLPFKPVSPAGGSAFGSTPQTGAAPIGAPQAGPGQPGAIQTGTTDQPNQ